MTAINATNIIKGNLASEPKYWPAGQYAARVTFRIMHTARRLDPADNQWKDGSTTVVEANMFGTNAERYIDLITENPTMFAKGTPVIAMGMIADKPSADIDRNGKPQAMSTLNADNVLPDLIAIRQRAEARNRRQNPSTPDNDPWIGNPEEQPEI